MKIPILIVVAMVLAIGTLTFLQRPLASAESDARPLSVAPFVVVELFTSEGCSSCPAADALASELSRTYSKLPVYVLAYHVDYWDYIGWKDDLAKPEFTERQYRYGSQFNLNSVYTPQMIVNGRSEFVGSNRSKTVEAIRASLDQPSRIMVTFSQTIDGSHDRIDYELSSVPEGATVFAAVVESGIVRKIGRGENSGRTLHHDNVVRDLKNDAVSSTRGAIGLAIPADAVRSNCAIVVFVQDLNGTILGANGHALDLQP